MFRRVKAWWRGDVVGGYSATALLEDIKKHDTSNLSVVLVADTEQFTQACEELEEALEEVALVVEPMPTVSDWYVTRMAELSEWGAERRMDHLLGSEPVRGRPREEIEKQWFEDILRKVREGTVLR